MNHYYGLAYRYLKQQKKRSVLTVIGIILSMALIFSAAAMGEALKDDMIESVKLRQGNLHVAYTGLNEDQLRQLQEHVKVETVAARQFVGFHTVRYGMTINVTGGGKEYLKVLSMKLEEGRLPEQDGELALERWVLDSMEGKPKLGDKVKLKLSAAPPARGSGAKKDAEAVPAIEAEFTLSGILMNQKNTQQSGIGHGITSLQYAKSLAGAPPGGYDAAVLLKKGLKLQAGIKEISAAIGAREDQTFPNEPLLKALGESKDKNSNRELLIAESIAVGIILITTVAVIYNAFHISVLERIRQFGIFRSIGMTPGQIRRLVFREAAILAAIGIPLGILAGWGTIEALMAIFRWMDGGQFAGSLEINFHWYVPVVTAGIGLIAIFASAFGPAFAAGRITPLDAILNRNQFGKEKALKRRRFRLRLPFGFTGRMALDNLQRNRRRYRITLFSMSIGIVLYVFFTSFLYFVQGSEAAGFSKDMALDRFARENPGYSLQDYEDIAAVPGVKYVYRIMEDSLHVQVKTGKLTPDYLKNRPASEFAWLETEVQGLRAAELAELKSGLLKGSIDPSAMDAENGVVVFQKVNLQSGAADATDLQIGDVITIGRYAEGSGYTEQVQVKVMAIAEYNPMSPIFTPHYSIATTEKVFRAAAGREEFKRFHIELDAGADHDAVKQRMVEISERVEGGRVLDYSNDNARIVMLQISIMLYGLVAVVSLISAINIIHTISTNLILRTREFGTLRAVGMTMKQMRRMIVIESIWYGIMATLYGGTAGTLLAYWFYSSLNAVHAIPYHFPLAELLTAGAASALICLLASRVPLSRIERMDIVKAVRAEE